MRMNIETGAVLTVKRQKMVTTKNVTVWKIF